MPSSPYKCGKCGNSSRRKPPSLCQTCDKSNLRGHNLPEDREPVAGKHWKVKSRLVLKSEDKQTELDSKSRAPVLTQDFSPTALVGFLENQPKIPPMYQGDGCLTALQRVCVFLVSIRSVSAMLLETTKFCALTCWPSLKPGYVARRRSRRRACSAVFLLQAW